MLTETRQEEIVRLVQERESITVSELKDILHSSESTIRRDITALDQAGRLIKVFGGAIARHQTQMHSEELTVVQKQDLQTAEKQQIAQYAASLIEPGDCVYIDAGTTTGWLVEYIHEPGATYVTNAISHAKRLSQKGFHVILIGGELKQATEAIVGAEAVLSIQKYHFTKGFFGTNGIDEATAFTTPDINEASVKQVAMRNTQSGHRYVLAVSAKFSSIYAVTFADYNGAVILTEQRPAGASWENIPITVVPSREPQ